MNILFLDTETTGSNPSSAEICEFAFDLWEYDGMNPVKRISSLCSLVKPTIEIEPEASAVNHITNEMVAGAPSAQDHANAIMNIAGDASYLCAHNIPFDYEILTRIFPGIFYQFDPLSKIDTLRLAKHTFDDIPSYSLQALRYRYKLDGMIPDRGEAHRASFDTDLVRVLLNRCMEGKESAFTGWDDMIKFIQSTIEVKTFKYGKYVGANTYHICKKDKGYAQWAIKNLAESDPDLCATLKMYLGCSNRGEPLL